MVPSQKNLIFAFIFDENDVFVVARVEVEENIETLDTSTVRTIRAVRSEYPSASITDYRRKHSRDRKLIVFCFVLLLVSCVRP